MDAHHCATRSSSSEVADAAGCKSEVRRKFAQATGHPIQGLVLAMSARGEDPSLLAFADVIYMPLGDLIFTLVLVGGSQD